MEALQHNITAMVGQNQKTFINPRSTFLVILLVEKLFHKTAMVTKMEQAVFDAENQRALFQDAPRNAQIMETVFCTCFLLKIVQNKTTK